MSGYRQFCLAKVVLNKADNLLYMKGSSGWRIAYRQGGFAEDHWECKQRFGWSAAADVIRVK
jgi:hypothetical protein